MELLTYRIWRFVSPVSTDIRVVPLAFPLITGPGAITSVVISLQTYGYLCTFAAIALALVATYIILRSKDIIYHILRRRGLIVITRVLAFFCRNCDPVCYSRYKTSTAFITLGFTAFLQLTKSQETAFCIARMFSVSM